MTFNDLQNNTSADADDVMENFRNTNYGSDLIPVDTDGDGVDAALDVGTSIYRWRTGVFSGNVLPQGQFRAAGGFARFSGGTASCPNNAWTAVEFTNDDLGGLAKIGITHSTSTNPEQWTLQGQGVWFVSGCVTFLGNGTGIRGAGFRRNGATINLVSHIQTGVATNDNTVSFSGYITSSTSSDIIEMVVFQNSGGFLNIRQSPSVDTSINPNQGSTRFQIWRVA
jgi:hypothetical protein